MQLMDRVSLMHFNLSPQGDGNPTLTPVFISMILFQLIPARGRKQSLSNKHSNCHNFNLSPQGGKKLRIKNGAEFFFCVP